MKRHTTVAASFERAGFFADRSGGLSTLLALALPAGMVLFGGLIDTALYYTRQSNLQGAADAAALAAASSTTTDLTELGQIADRYFAANLGDELNIGALDGNLTVNNGEFVYSVTGRSETVFMQAFGDIDIGMNVVAMAIRETTTAEVVLVIDTTASMGFGNSWDDARAAMFQMLNTLDKASTDNDLIVTLLPMSDRVNLGKDNDQWLNISPPPDDWEGCLEPREEAHPAFPHALSDAPPAQERFAPTADGHHISLIHTRGSRFNCPETIAGPTSDVSTLASVIDGLDQQGSGRFDTGLAWAWRLISPNWRGEWPIEDYPAAYGESRKVVIFVTDMHTNAYNFEVGAENGGSFGNNAGSRMGFEHFVHVCDQMTSVGIELHMVYVNGNDHGVPFMQQCANDERFFHDVTTMADLVTTLEEIQSSLTRVRLIR